MGLLIQRRSFFYSLIRSSLCWGLLLFLGACAGRPLLGEIQVPFTTLRPLDGEGAFVLSYQLGQDAKVSITVEDEKGQSYDLRREELRAASADPYILQFDGTVPVPPPLSPKVPHVVRQLLPTGSYTLTVHAQTAKGQEATKRVPLHLVAPKLPLPALENLTVSPTTISPNADALADVAEITYRLPTTATVDITFTTPKGQTFPFITRAQEQPAEWQHIWNGKRPDGELLPSGVYTYTINAADQLGNLVQQQGNITLVDSGQPEATITYANIAPQHLMLGEMLTLTLRVKNTGTIPLRTYGPPSGFTYTTDAVFSSVEGGKFTSQAGGFWRVGLDWDANSGGGPKRYPFRWALSQRPPDQWQLPGQEDWLLPGEEVTIFGHVRVLQRETKMDFYVGLIQDGVGFFQDRHGRTIVYVGF